MPAPLSARPALMLTGAAACWGIGTVISKHALATIDPLVLLVAQLSTSTVFLVAVLIAFRTPISWTPQLRRLGALGVLNPGVAYALGLIGLSSITASMSVLIWASEPVLIVLLAAAVLHERPSGWLRTMLAAAVAGVVLVIYQPGAGGSPSGVLLTIAAVTACALYTVAARKLMVDDVSLVVTAAQQAAALGFAVVLLAIVRLLSEGGAAVASVPANTWMWAVVSGLLYYGIAFWLYLSGLAKVDASVAGSFLPLIPVFGIAGALVLGERLTTMQWLGAATVVTAVALMATTQMQASRQPRVEATKGR